jgi:hypothetical protein
MEDLLAVEAAILTAGAALLGESTGPLAVVPALDPESALARVAGLLELDAAGRLLVRILLAGTRSRAAHRMLRRLAIDPTEPGFEVDALVGVAVALGSTGEDVLDALAPDGPLVGCGIVVITGAGDGPPLSRRVMLTDRVTAALQGRAVPLSTKPPLRQVWPVAIDDLVLPEGPDELLTVELLDTWLSRTFDGEPLWLVGPTGAGRRTAVASVLALRGLQALSLEWDALADLEPETVVPRLYSEALLGRAVIVIHDVRARSEDGDVQLRGMYAALVRRGVPVVFTSSEPRGLDLVPQPRMVRFGVPSLTARTRLFDLALDDGPLAAKLASRFPLPPGRIHRAATSARSRAAEASRAPTAADVAAAVSAQVADRVAAIGTRIHVRQRWEDLILPPEANEGVQELLARARHRHQVFEEWGFRRKVGRGLGLTALFSGPPGTGKTMVAGLIAQELGLDLYQIDLSRIVSKWIGETEKNLGAVFDAAEGANVLLLFDEADALFTKRTEVKSSNDRHANAEVNFLLQRIERFEGISLLTTNLETSIDPAFRRRLAFRIQFAIPQSDERERLWRAMMPDEAKVGTAIEFKALAERYELSGGNIRNAVVRAAFLAASAGEAIGSRHMLRAVELEYRDAGKVSAGGRMT